MATDRAEHWPRSQDGSSAGLIMKMGMADSCFARQPLTITG